MKKTFYIFTVILLITIAPAMAQKHFYVGVAGGPSTTWITNQQAYGIPPMDYSFNTSYGMNLSIGYDFNKTVGLKTELGYAVLGQKYKDNIHDSAVSRLIKLNYLSVPILLKVRAGGEIAQFYLLVGPQFNFLMSAKQDYTIGGKPFPDTYIFNGTDTNYVAGRAKSDIKERFASMDIFARLDLGADIYVIKSLFINVGITFAYGLFDINATDWRMVDNNGNYSASHNVYGHLNIGLNYRF
ncbi:MAG: outer membrane beta-barrel protein [Bacteroidetes bacterium]|nr:outer membrane beta-barrel protein [Bacteroidota bacterium]